MSTKIERETTFRGDNIESNRETGLKVGTKADISIRWVCNKSRHTICSIAEDITNYYGFCERYVKDVIIDFLGYRKISDIEQAISVSDIDEEQEFWAQQHAQQEDNYNRYGYNYEELGLLNPSPTPAKPQRNAKKAPVFRKALRY